MANATPPSDPQRGLRLELDRPRHLRMTLGALKRVEELSGIGIHQQEELAAWSKTLDGVVGFLWAGLVHEDPELTVEDVYEIVDIHNFGQIRAALDEAIGIAMPAPGAGENGTSPRPLAPSRAERRHPSPGTPSGPSAFTTTTSPQKRSGV
jgi:hypothetical protein